MRAVFPRGKAPRALLLLTVVALLGLATGFILSTRVVSPAQAEADAAPPAAGPIAIPIDERMIANNVVIRGEGSYDDALELSLETGSVDGPVVVTGSVPRVGDELAAGSVALEVVGRPVIVLPGAIPVYRTLSAGMSGPDVRQLKDALASIGIDPGDQESDEYDKSTSSAVRELYGRVGYEPPAPSTEASEQLRAARLAESSARQAVDQMARELAAAGAGIAAADLIELNTAVAVAQQTLADAQAACLGQDDQTTAPDMCSQVSVVEAQGALDAALARRDAAQAAPDTAAQTAALAAARDALDAATNVVSDAERATLTTLPASEVVFVPALPRRVDEIDVQLGGRVSGPIMTVSGAQIAVVAAADADDAALLQVGMVGSVQLDATEIPVTVVSVESESATASTESETTPAPTATDGSGADDAETSVDPRVSGAAGAPTAGDSVVVLKPSADLAPEIVSALRDANVRVTIPVSSTGGAVLAVPLAAVTAGPDGTSRVSVQQDDGSFSLLGIETGLAAAGYVEVKHADGPLGVGDRVAIGNGEQPGDDK
ncbi:MAG: hypothetical protein HGA44_09610 [Cellulomonadaceae bacterium]|nr:hypothetical protein [Cellulomonadaceae bacterium]